MSDKEGVLRMQSSGRWTVCRPGGEPVEVTSGELFRVEVDGEMRVTRKEFRHFTTPSGQPVEYYSVDGYQLRDSMRAVIGNGG